MSEEILQALTQLFAIISKQDDGVTEIEQNFVENYFRQNLDEQSVDEYIELFNKKSTEGKKSKITRVTDSVKTLAACRRINRTLNQKQKVIVLVKLLELLASDRNFTPQRMAIINTVSTVFNVPPHEYKLIESFVIEEHSSKIDHEDILIFDDERPPENSKIKFIDSGVLDGEIIFVRVRSVGLYFTKYTGEDEIYLNNQATYKDTILQFSPGSVFRTPKGSPLYYSDLVTTYNSDLQVDNISFNVQDMEFTFPGGHIGLRNINISEGPGNLIGIMGASGAGKTTLLNALAGLETPSNGEVLINGYNIHTQKDKIEGVIGYIAQDDLLIEELTVYQNLYYNAKLCFKNLSEEDIDAKVKAVLDSLGLDRIADLVVGNVFNKKISGGQRKRLNIALELIREPAVMFVDEPTSGLSSRDSENVIDLLKELSLKGKLIFVVIHQPSSDIYKMFDKMFIMDTGGYPIFYGDPIEAIIYFKKATNQVGSDRGQCQTCGNVNPEQLFNIVEAQVVDEYGEFTNKRKLSPQEWHKHFQENFKLERVKEVDDAPPTTLSIPSKFKQSYIFTVRDFLSKISNTQYLLINLLEAPLLALILSLIIRYKKTYDGEYIFRHNDNIPAYILICIIIALFMGLTVSAEEIIKDRKILKREKFLNLSRSSYLVSKIVILFVLSAIQTISFVIIGNSILEIDGLNMMYWVVLFTISCHANVLGLNISSAFNSAVTVYIIIPLLLIPEMILSGLIFDFDKLNHVISERGKVPIIADFMASRWGFEAITVEQYKNNKYNKLLFPFEMIESENYFKGDYWKPKMEEIIENAIICKEDPGINDPNQADSIKRILKENLEILKYELTHNEYSLTHAAIDYQSDLTIEKFDSAVAANLRKHLETSYFEEYNPKLIRSSDSKDSILYVLETSLEEGESLETLKNDFFNDRLAELLKNTGTEKRIVVSDQKIIQVFDPIFNPPSAAAGLLDYRTHFYAPQKHIFGKYFNTFSFNMTAIWFMTILLYITLYYEVLGKILDSFGKLGGVVKSIKIKKSKK